MCSDIVRLKTRHRIPAEKWAEEEKENKIKVLVLGTAVIYHNVLCNLRGYATYINKNCKNPQYISE